MKIICASCRKVIAETLANINNTSVVDYDLIYAICPQCQKEQYGEYKPDD